MRGGFVLPAKLQVMGGCVTHLDLSTVVDVSNTASPTLLYRRAVGRVPTGGRSVTWVNRSIACSYRRSMSFAAARGQPLWYEDNPSTKHASHASQTDSYVHGPRMTRNDHTPSIPCNCMPVIHMSQCKTSRWATGVHGFLPQLFSSTLHIHSPADPLQ